MKLFTISLASGEQTTRYPAVIAATRSTDLSFQVGGLIEELPVRQAQIVNEGELIARLDQRDLRSQLATARAQFDAAVLEYERAERLLAQDAIAAGTVDQRRTSRDVAEAQLDSAEKALSDSVLLAPFSGVVAAVEGSRQENVSPGEVVITLINTEMFDAKINVPAAVIAQTPTREDRGAFVYLDAAPEQALEAVFKNAELVADATSQTYEVTMTFKPPEGMIILPGMNATVAISTGAKVTDEASRFVGIPLAAIQSDSDGEFVWLLDPDSMVVSRRGVVVEPGIGDTLVISSGLSEGDQIVAAGGAYLSGGLEVRPWTE